MIQVLLQHGIDAEELEKLVKSSKTTRGKNTLPLLHIAASRGSVKVTSCWPGQSFDTSSDVLCFL